MQKTLSFGRPQCSWFTYSCAVFLTNLILVILSHVVPGLVYAAPIVFIATMVCWGSAIMFHKREETEIGDAFAESDKWCIIVAGIAVIYTIISFIQCMSLLSEGVPFLQNGRFYLYNRGHGIVREITKEEYNSLMIVEGRLFLSGILPFSTLALVFHSGRKNMNA